jgi:hypothetical protein
VGHWKEVEPSYLGAYFVHCQTCGKMIPRHVWVEEICGDEKDFCGTQCAELYVSYWLPKYGEKSAANT